ncbi:MAG TPA: pentapeptide repeat-containing protein [Rhizomicrobium sp.]
MLKNLHGEKRTLRSQQELDAVIASHERFIASKGGTRAQLGGLDLSNLHLEKRILREADFSGSAFVNATMWGADLERASLYCADLQDCDLRRANLQHADMRGVSLKGANLAFAKLDNADMRAAMMMYMSPDGISILNRESASDGGVVDFSNCSLKKASFGNAKLHGANFSGALLQGVNFRGAKLSDANFSGAVLTGVNLQDLQLPAETFKDCVTDISAQAQGKFDELRGRLDAHQQWIVTGGKQGNHCVLDGEDIRPLLQLVVGRPLTGLSARNAIAVGLNFSGCQLQGARFDGADLRDVDFTGADLRGASFAGAKISHACFNKADLRTLELSTGQARPANLCAAVGSLDQFGGALLDGQASDLGLAGQAAA